MIAIAFQLRGIVSKLFGDYIRAKREALRKDDPEFSIRRVARRIGIHHSYLSKIERGEPASLTQKRVIALAEALGEDPDLLMVMSGKVPESVRRAAFRNPDQVVEGLRRIKAWR